MQLCPQKFYSNTILKIVVLQYFFRIFIANPRHKILEIFKNCCLFCFSVSNLEQFFECLLLQCDCCEFILLQFYFGDFQIPGGPCFQILKSNHRFTFSPLPGPPVSLTLPFFQVCTPMDWAAGRHKTSAATGWASGAAGSLGLMLKDTLT